MKQLDATSLTALLSPRPGPVLTWFLDPGISSNPPGTPSIRERVELSGPVARRWLAKTDNFLANEFPFGASSFAEYLTTHWRTPLWIAACWLRGLRQRPPRNLDQIDLAVSNDLDFLMTMQVELGPDVLVAQTPESFAFSWPGDLPFGITDGTADVMSYGDEVEMPHTAPGATVIVGNDIDWLPPNLLEDPQKTLLRLDDLLTRDYLGLEGELSNPASRLDQHRVLVTTANPTLFTAQLIQLWLRGASVVWVPGGVDAESIATTEKVTLTVPSR